MYGKGMGVAGWPEANSAEMRYLTVPCGALSSTIAAADASGPPEHRGRRERGRRDRVAETPENIAEKRKGLQIRIRVSPAHTSPSSLFRSQPAAFLFLHVPVDNRGW